MGIDARYVDAKSGWLPPAALELHMTDRGYSLMAGSETFMSVNTYVRGDGKSIFGLHGFGDQQHLYVWADVTENGYMVGGGARLKDGGHLGPGMSLSSNSTQDIGAVVIDWDERAGLYKCMLKQAINDSTFVGMPYEMREAPSKLPITVLDTVVQRAEVRFSIYDRSSYEVPGTEGFIQLGFASTDANRFGIYARVLGCSSRNFKGSLARQTPAKSAAGS